MSALAIVNDLLQKLDASERKDDEKKGSEIGRKIVHPFLLNNEKSKKDASTGLPYETIHLKRNPVGKPDVVNDFELSVSNTDILSVALKTDEVLIKVLYISVDPYLRGRMNSFWKSKTKDIISGQIGQIIKISDDNNKDSNFKLNDLVLYHGTWSTYNIMPIKRIYLNISQHINNPKYCGNNNNNDISRIPLPYYLGAYGMPGQTAMYGLLDIGKIKQNECVLISAAAGAVGSIAAQICKNIFNCYVIGTVSNNNEKKEWLTNELKLDGIIDYTQFNNNIDLLTIELKKQFPNGIDLYFDNTGGFITQSVFNANILNRHSRVLICGQISIYNKGANIWDANDNTQGNIKPPKIDDFLYKLLYLNCRLEGFVVTDYKDKTQFYKSMAKWINENKINVKDTILKGFKNTPQAFVNLFESKNIGKMVVQLVED